MSDEKLVDVWWEGAYPFDCATDCCYCLTSHAIQTCPCDEHAAMTKEIPLVRKRETGVSYIRKNLVKLFALRRKYDRFYKKVKP